MFIQCNNQQFFTTKTNLVPQGFPPINYPADNEPTIARIELGRKLFYDPILSIDSTKSCASCHSQHLAFSDSTAFSFGVKNQIGERNAPSLANVAYAPYFFVEGGVPTLEQQVLVPIQEHTEFNFNIGAIANRMKQIPDYVKLSNQAYNQEPNAFVITRAIAAFERTFLSGNSAYDKFYFQNNKDALSLNAKAGLKLFTSDSLACNKCHAGFTFTNYQFKNNGLYDNYKDLGRMRLTNKKTDKALFKTPSLRNIALSAPYMHDGSMVNLSQVINHYSSGGKNHFNKSPLIKGFKLTETEKKNLIAFLESLTDYEFINNPDLSNPFKTFP